MYTCATRALAPAAMADAAGHSHSEPLDERHEEELLQQALAASQRLSASAAAPAPGGRDGAASHFEADMQATVDTRESFVEQKIAAGLGQEMANDIVGAVKREFKDKEKQIEELINRAQMMGVLSDGDMKTLADQGDEGGGKAGGGDDHVARAEQRLAKLMQDKKKLVRDKLAAVLGAGDVDNMIAQIENQCEGLPTLALPLPLPALPPTPPIAWMWGQSAPLQHCACYNSGHPPIHTHVQQPQEPQPLGPSHSPVPCDHSRARCRCNL